MRTAYQPANRDAGYCPQRAFELRKAASLDRRGSRDERESVRLPKVKVKEIGKEKDLSLTLSLTLSLPLAP